MSNLKLLELFYQQIWKTEKEQDSLEINFKDNNKFEIILKCINLIR